MSKVSDTWVADDRMQEVDDGRVVAAKAWTPWPEWPAAARLDLAGEAGLGGDHCRSQNHLSSNHQRRFHRPFQ
jgi:hypothetical protein